jgi:radical SAM superfamily enzyme
MRLARNPLIHTVAHIILGLPDETEEDVTNVAKWLNRYKVGGVKIHNIVVLRDTALASMYERNIYRPPEKSVLLDFYKIFFQHIKKDIVIHRLTTDASPEYIIAPEYARNKNILLRDIKKVIDKSGSDIP